jgi:hypothetical protein
MANLALTYIDQGRLNAAKSWRCRMRCFPVSTKCYDWLDSLGLTNGHAKEVPARGLGKGASRLSRDFLKRKWSHSRILALASMQQRNNAAMHRISYAYIVTLTSIVRRTLWSSIVNFVAEYAQSFYGLHNSLIPSHTLTQCCPLPRTLPWIVP